MSPASTLRPRRGRRRRRDRPHIVGTRRTGASARTRSRRTGRHALQPRYARPNGAREAARMDRTDRAIAIGAAALLSAFCAAAFAFVCWNWTLDHYDAGEPAVSPSGLRVAQVRGGEEPYSLSVYMRYRFLPFGQWSKPIAENCWRTQLRWRSSDRLQVTCTRYENESARIVRRPRGVRIELAYIAEDPASVAERARIDAIYQAKPRPPAIPSACLRAAPSPGPAAAPGAGRGSPSPGSCPGRG